MFVANKGKQPSNIFVHIEKLLNINYKNYLYCLYNKVSFNIATPEELNEWYRFVTPIIEELNKANLLEAEIDKQNEIKYYKKMMHYYRKNISRLDDANYYAEQIDMLERYNIKTIYFYYGFEKII